MILTPQNVWMYLTQFLLCSYASGWILTAMHAKKYRIIDLCQFLRLFIFAPFVFAFFAALIVVVWVVIFPNILSILLGVGLVIAGCVILGLLGYFVIGPTVKKAHGIAKPFSEKICIVIYRGNHRI